MEREQSIIVQRHGTVHSEKEIDHQGEFQDHVRGQFFGQVLIAFPSVLYTIDIEFWRPYKLTSFAQVTFQNRNGIVQGKA